MTEPTPAPLTPEEVFAVHVGTQRAPFVLEHLSEQGYTVCGPDCGCSCLNAATLDRERAEPSLEVLALLNSLGIAGPNIIHVEQGMYPDGKHSADDTWDGPGWCVCRRTWPCEALRLDTVIRLTLAVRLAAIPVAKEPKP